MTIEAGEIDYAFEAYQGTVVDLNGGNVRGELKALRGSVVNVHGGEIGGGLFNRVVESQFNVLGGSARRFTVDNAELNLSGGRFVDAVISDSEVNIHGGEYGDFRLSGGAISFQGGQLDGGFWAGGSDVTLYGTNFMLNGNPIEGLNDPGDHVVLTTEDGDILDAAIMGGDDISYRIVGRRSGAVAISVDSRITLVYAVPEPAGLFLSMTAAVSVLLYSRRMRTKE